ncbi:hypothetical protein ABEO75_16820 [Paenibacillus macerans]|uniref:hypothetical protein n=1 Tax=Paenibacillus macerans TaxID=44252 RepID=UPI003D292FED
MGKKNYCVNILNNGIVIADLRYMVRLGSIIGEKSGFILDGADNKTLMEWRLNLILKIDIIIKITVLIMLSKKNRGYMIYGTLRASDQYTTGAAKVTNMTDTGVTFTYQE